MTTEIQRLAEEAVTRQVVDSFATTTDPRLSEVLRSLVSHLHSFIREVRLTELEWSQAIEFLTATGHLCDDRRQEFILLSDVLGASMQVVAVNNERQANATEATVFGPFFVDEAPHIDNGGDATFGALGEPCWVEGTVSGVDGAPVAGARIDVWQADEDGFYDVQYGDDRMAGRAQLTTDDAGSYRFWAVTPTPYPIPHDGPVGNLLAATSRSPMRASHLHFMVAAAGWRTLVTHIFVAGCDYLDTDSVFGVKESLIKDFIQHSPNDLAPDGRRLDRSWTSVRFDIVLATAGA